MGEAGVKGGALQAVIILWACGGVSICGIVVIPEG